jgi:hypothetical protein
MNPLIPMEVSDQFHVPAALPLNEAGCVPPSVFFGEEMNMLSLPGTTDDSWLRSEYRTGCRVLTVPGGPEVGAWTECYWKCWRCRSHGLAAHYVT